MIYGNCTMVSRYKSQSFGVVGSNTQKVLRWMAMGSPLLTSPCIIASQVAQVLYVADPTKMKKYVVVPEK
jgi:hypothetical protein